MSEVFEKIARFQIVPVLSIESSEAAIPLADALLDGGLPVAEITFRTSAAAAVIEKIASQRPEVLIGAGTVLTKDNLKAAIDAGARFAVAPGLNLRILEAARAANFPFIPGVCTPSDIEAALECGIRVLKFFPAGPMGGLPFLKSLLAPYAHTGIQLMPTGGVTIDNLKDYLATPGVLACGGTWIASKDDIAQGRWETITARCKEAIAQRSTV